MGRHVRPSRVYQTAVANLGTSIFKGKANVAPAWLKAVEAIPPSEIMTRPYPIQHTAPNPRTRRPRNIFRPTRIVYPEDQLRQEFYRDHPWELARPRMVLELDGKDGRYWDWSTGVEQPGIPLCGECVVQRQLWLMENAGQTKEQAYDTARREFYQLRHREEVQRRIAKEEAQMVGAYFGKSALRVGMELEDKEFERWKKWAAQEISQIQAERSQAYTSFGEESKDVADLEEELEAGGAPAPV